MEYNNQLGWVEVICGPMFAGKSEELIRRVRRIQYAKKKVVVFKPTIDNRYSEGEVVSHNKRSVKSINIQSSSEIMNYITDDVFAVAFDEVQFMDEGIVSVCQTLADRAGQIILRDPSVSVPHSHGRHRCRRCSGRWCSPCAAAD